MILKGQMSATFIPISLKEADYEYPFGIFAE